MLAFIVSSPSVLPIVNDVTAQNSTASPADTGNLCNDINNCRTKLQIIWSCIVVLVACTWASIHPNIPGPMESWLTVLRRKIGLMMLCLLAPELLVLWAARQWVDAWLLSNRYRSQGWTMTHAMFALMGGFVLYDGDNLVSVLRFCPLDQCSFSAHVDVIGHIPEREIKDRSHIDWFGKLIAIGQTSWFIAQLIARWVQKIAVTELEVMTVAFATLNFMIYYFWWDKPMEVGCPIHIQIMPKNSNLEIGEEGNGSKFLHLSSDQALHDSPGRPMPLLIKIALYQKAAVTFEGPSYRILSFEWDSNLQLQQFFLMGSWLSTAAAMIFGAIHCTAWNFIFPTELERLLWRISSLITTLAPILIIYMASGSYLITTQAGKYLEIMGNIIFMAAVISYGGARLALIVQPFLALRDLPPSALQDVAWTTFIPHI
ncbi:hypothetical protein GYMLUDRAFT_218437 [Collybiopsis luxurians FD-317 M1]|nr:hypothetical protein GYMLUDRAFT_218437 [Collybiopsis luxurians FD-317 M1]